MKFRLIQYLQKYFKCSVVVSPLNASVLTLTIIDHTSIRLDWISGGEDELGFSIERSTNNITWVEISTVAYNLLTFTDTSLTANYYYYRIRSFRGLKYSPYSNVVTNDEPLILFNTSETIAWYDFTELSTLTIDGSNRISRWNDKLGSGHDLLATTTARPTLGLTGISFDGISNYMKTSAFTYNQPEMMYFVIKVFAGNSNRALGDGNTSASALIYQIGYILDTPTPYAGVELKANEIMIGSYHILRVLFNGVISTIQHNLLAKKTGNTGAGNAGGITVGAWGSNDKFGTFEVKEIIYRNVADNNAAQTAIYNYLRIKYGDNVFSHVVPSVIYVSPGGTGDGSTASNAASFDGVIGSDNVIAGDTIIMLDGVYDTSEKGTISGSNEVGKGVFQINLLGTAALPITIYPQTKNTVRINGGVEMLNGQCAYVTLHGVEIAPTPTTRTFPTYADIDIPKGVYITAPGCKVYDCYIHDGSDNAFFGTGGIDFYGNVLGHMGYCIDHNTDYGIYTHNQNGGLMNIQRNVFLYNYGPWGVNMWSDTTNNVLDYRTNDNVFIAAGTLMSSNNGQTDNNEFNDNLVFCGDVNLSDVACRFGQYADGDRVSVQRNYFVFNVGAPVIESHLRPIFKNNISVILDTPQYPLCINYIDYPLAVPDIDNNAYYDELGSSHYGAFAHDLDYIQTIEEWRTSTGFDANSTFTEGLPADSVQIREMIAGQKWSVSIINWSEAASVDVDMSAYVTDPCIVRNAEDYLSDTFNWNGEGLLSLDMVNRTFKTPTANDSPDPLAGTCFPRFGCFIIEKA